MSAGDLAALASDRTVLANDRTALAWARTAFTCILGGAAFAKLGGDGGGLDGLSLVLALTLLAAGQWLMWCGWRSVREEGRRLGHQQASVAANSSMAIVSVLFAMLLVWVWRLRAPPPPRAGWKDDGFFHAHE
jgi:uncharacterized membrane protein YidH (DUF202 family)